MSSEGVNNAVTVSFSSTGGGGDVHMRELLKVFKRYYGLNITNITIPLLNGKFDILSNFVTLISSLFSRTPELPSLDRHSTVVVSSSPYPANVITSVRIARKNGYPCLVYFHHITDNFKFLTRRGPMRVFINYVVSSTSLVICRVFDIAIFLDNHDFYDLPLERIYEDEDAPSFGPNCQSSISAVKEFDICYIGRFEKHKGSEDIVKVIEYLNSSGMGVKAVIIGSFDAHYKGNVEKRMKERAKNSSVTFTGYVSEDEKISILSSSKVYLHLSYEEGWSLSVMDAAALGIPIVAYDLFAYSYLKGHFYSVTAGDRKAASKAIADIISNYGEALRIAELAKSVVRSYKYEKIAEYQIDCYNRELSRNGIRRSLKQNKLSKRRTKEGAL